MIVGTEVVGLLVFLLAQTGTFIWWAGRTTEKLNYVLEQLTEMHAVMQKDGYARCQLHEQRIKQFEDRLNYVEDKIS